MWMVGYNEGGEFNMGDYPFSGRKLRPLMPRPVPTTSPNNTSTITPSLNRANDLFSQYHHHHHHNHNLQQGGDESKRSELNNNQAAAVVVSSRWNPTAEQLRALEELYRRGTRTPSAEQIQQITAQLRRFGKIEGKNVFYWFQNHKARERQKRRRQMESASEFDTKKELGASRTVFEVEHTKNWLPSTNSSSTSTLPLAEESVSIQRAAAAAAAAKADGWLQFDEAAELQQRRNFMERNATWHMMQLTCPTLLNTTQQPTMAIPPMDPKLIKTHALNFFISPNTNTYNKQRENTFIHLNNTNTQDHQSHQTLQLFPIRNEDHHHHHNIINQHKETEISTSAINAPNQFIEFLPLKN